MWISEYVLTFHLTSCLGPKIQGFCSKINCNQMKPLYFENSFTDWSSKNGHAFKNKVLRSYNSQKDYLITVDFWVKILSSRTQTVS